jgi:uncharacterized membrane protein
MRKGRLTVSFFLTVVALLLTLAGCFLAYKTYTVFKYTVDRWMVVAAVVAVWAMAFLVVNTLLRGEKPFALTALYAVAVFCLVVAICIFIKPCLSPIGIYFTVHNMGDVETNAVGVPMSIATAAVLLLAVFSLLFASFGRLEKTRRGKGGAR